MTDETRKRKLDHLRVFRDEDVSFRKKTTWFEYVDLVPCALPDLSWDELDLSTTFCGHRFDAPLMITAITGGTDEARAINRSLARVAQQFGIGFGVGSQRAMLEDPALIDTYAVRDVAPDVFLAGNISAVQLKQMTPAAMRNLVDAIGADALCVHLNAAQELMQPEGDRDFSGLLAAIETAAENLSCPVIAKEVGCGIGREVAIKLKRAGVQAIDLAGAGGTSWVGMELRRRGQVKHYEYETFWDWGLPTAAALGEAAGLEIELLASGGIRYGQDVAKSLALGSSIAGMAGPILTTYFQGGDVAVAEWLGNCIADLKRTMLLCGCKTVADLAVCPRVVHSPLADWLSQRT